MFLLFKANSKLVDPFLGTISVVTQQQIASVLSATAASHS